MAIVSAAVCNACMVKMVTKLYCIPFNYIIYCCSTVLIVVNLNYVIE